MIEDLPTPPLPDRICKFDQKIHAGADGRAHQENMVYFVQRHLGEVFIFIVVVTSNLLDSHVKMVDHRDVMTHQHRRNGPLFGSSDSALPACTTYGVQLLSRRPLL